MKNSYRIKVGDIAVELNSLDEVALLIRRLSPSASATMQSTVTPANGNKNGTSQATSPGQWTEALYLDFRGSLNPQRQKILDLWIKHPNGITDEDLSEAMGFSSGKMLGGTLSGFVWSAKRVGFKVADVYIRKDVRKDDKWMNEYHLNKTFRAVAERCRK